VSVADILEKALLLPPALRSDLAEKIVESLAADIDPIVEASHLDEIQRRQKEAAANPGSILPGEQVLERIRTLIQK